jgi:hypothetical protein
MRVEYTSDTTVSLFFDTTKAGKGATTVVVLSVTSGTANDVVKSIASTVANSNRSVFEYNDVSDSFFTPNVTGVSSITTTEEPTITGADGADGVDGVDGVGVPAGGSQFQLLRKVNGDDYNTEWDYADRVTLEVRFDEAVSKGDPLYITGFNTGQNRTTVAKADASDSAKMPSIGLAFADYSLNDNGQATTIGSLDDVNTQTAPNDFQEGDVLYVNSGGGLTNVKPTGTNLIQNVGKVSRRQSVNGQIVVMAIGRSNDLPNLSEGKYWVGGANDVPTESSTLTHVYLMNFFDDLNTTKHWLPWKDINEQTFNYQEESAMLMPFDGRIRSISLKSSSLSADGDITIGVETIPTGSNVFSGANWTIEETETLSATSTDDHHTFHFVFDNAQHFEAGDSVAISIQTSIDMTGNGYWYATTIVDFDTSSDLGSTSTEHEVNP